MAVFPPPLTFPSLPFHFFLLSLFFSPLLLIPFMLWNRLETRDLGKHRSTSKNRFWCILRLKELILQQLLCQFPLHRKCYLSHKIRKSQPTSSQQYWYTGWPKTVWLMPLLGMTCSLHAVYWYNTSVSEWVSSFLTAHQHNIGYAVPYY